MEPKKLLSGRDGGVTPAFVEAALGRYIPPPARDDAVILPPYRPAAVLVPLLLRDDGLTVLFTRRASTLSHHGGQVSFPGGRMEAGETPAAAALREAMEEISLAIPNARVIGGLDPCVTVSRFMVTPVVALVTPQTFTPSPAEVDEIFEVPLADILKPGAFAVDHRLSAIASRPFYSFSWEQREIVGATAAMLRNLAEVVRGP